MSAAEGGTESSLGGDSVPISIRSRSSRRSAYSDSAGARAAPEGAGEGDDEAHPADHAVRRETSVRFVTAGLTGKKIAPSELGASFSSTNELLLRQLPD
jgi:hypothetical protein